MYQAENPGTEAGTSLRGNASAPRHYHLGLRGVNHHVVDNFASKHALSISLIQMMQVES